TRSTAVCAAGRSRTRSPSKRSAGKSPSPRRGSPEADRQLPRWFEQLDGISVGILDLDLPPAGPGLHLVAKVHVSALQRLDECGKIGDAKHDPIPSAGCLLLAIRHGPGARRLRPAEQDVRIAQRHVAERRKLLVFEPEAQMGRIERHRAGDVFDLISDAVNTPHEGVVAAALRLSGPGRVGRTGHLFLSSSCRTLTCRVFADSL